MHSHHSTALLAPSPPLTAWASEVQRGEATFLRLHRWVVRSPNFHHRVTVLSGKPTVLEGGEEDGIT